MDISKFIDGKAGKIEENTEIIDKHPEKYFYFYPNPLPIELTLESSTFNKLHDALLCLGELKGLTKTIRNINLFISTYKNREAVLSSKIEGTIVSLSDVFLSEAGSKERLRIKEILEVRNYRKSLNFALGELALGKSIDKNMINQMHGILLNRVRGSERKIGQYRERQNWIGRSPNIKEAEFVPPPAIYVPNLMEDLFRFVNESNLPSLIKICLMHYYFETIHPYEDGNGRLGRTLIILYLSQLKVIENPILYLSPFLEKNKDDYYELLMQIRKSGNFTPWLNFFLDGVAEVSVSTSQSIKKMLQLYDDYKIKLNEIRATSISFILLDKFFENPYSTIPNLQKQLNANYPLIKRGIGNLIKCDLIQEITEQKRNKFYVAPKVLEIVENT